MATISTRDKLKSALVSTTGILIAAKKSPDEALGQLFAEVQQKRVYADGKTFVDLIPRRRMKSIQQEYLLAKKDPTFDLQEFVARHFYEFDLKKTTYTTDPHMTISQHISALWDVLERQNRRDRGSLIALPHKYVVPGGRFSEQFYWDSYFIMLGLAADNRWDMVENMMKNYAYMIRKFGFIPTANRTYFLSRSQPPFFALMVKLYARHNGRTRTMLEYLPYMLAEYRFWMKGHSQVQADSDIVALKRVVNVPSGTLMNRYFDNKVTPRPESLREDVETASGAPDMEKLYLDLRAGAESGWDFSSRWFRDPHDIKSIHTTDIVPVDLNSLLYILESTIAESYEILKQSQLAIKFRACAERRAKAISQYNWDDAHQYFMDYDFRAQETTSRLTLAGVFPLYAKVATQKQAEHVADRIKKEFLKPGGLTATLEDTGQQWDSPNGWAPLQWIAIEGLRNYGYHSLANEIKKRWLKVNLKVFTEKRKMIEKYNVVSRDGLGGGGEYPLQDGFGWTNGVVAALLSEDAH